MKSLRIAAGLLAGVLVVASCGGGSSSSGTTERTRNAAFWAASTTPNKVIVYGTQDGFVHSVNVPSASGKVVPTTITSFTTITSGGWSPTVAALAVDTATSQAIIATRDATAGTQLSTINLSGSGRKVIHEKAGTYPLSLGYDSNTRVAALLRFDGGSMRFILQSIDEVGTTLKDSNQMFFAVPLYDGTNMLISTSEAIRKVSPTDPSITESTSGNFRLPRDVWGYAKDPASDAIFAARSDSDTIFSTDLSGASLVNKIESISKPASIAMFSDGSMAVGTGGSPISGTMIGGLSVIDTNGVNPIIELADAVVPSFAYGVQSVWAVESPIAAKAPAIDGDLRVGSTLSCSDATWKEDLPLSRLSRAPVASARSYQWFFDGTPISGATSETYVPTEEGPYSCAVVAVNYAGFGQSEESDSVKVTEAETTTTSSSTVASGDSSSTSSTSSTLAGTGGSAATPEVSPVVTVPKVAVGTPIVVVTPSLKSAKWTFKGRTAKVTFKKWSGAKKYRLSITGATKKTVSCKAGKSTVTCSVTTLKKGLNSFSAKALSTTGITLAMSSKTKSTK